MEITILVFLVIVFLISGLSLVAVNRLTRQLPGELSHIENLTFTIRSLEARFDRLVVAVNQSLQQLQRAMDLARSIYQQMYGVNRLEDQSFTLPEGSQIMADWIELRAIAVVNGDVDLIDRVNDLRLAIDQALDQVPAEDQIRRKITIAEATEAVQRKIYELLATATRRPQS